MQKGLNRHPFAQTPLFIGFFVIFSTVFTFSIPKTAQAAICAFTGAVSNDFQTDGNWDCGAVPDVSSDIVIPNGKTAELSSTSTVQSVTIEPLATLILKGRLLRVNGNWLDQGTLDASDPQSTVEFTGALVQTVAPESNFKNLTINKIGGTAVFTGDVTSTGNLSIFNGSVNLSDHTIHVGRNFYHPGSILTGDIEFNGAEDQTMNGGSVFARIIVRKPPGTTLTVIGGGSVFTYDFILYNGTFVIGPRNFYVYDIWNNYSDTFDGTGSTVIFNAYYNQKISAESHFHHVYIDKPAGRTITLNGHIALTGNLTLKNGIFDLNQQTLRVKGNWNNSGGILNGNGGTVEFNGTDIQSINTESGFFRVRIFSSSTVTLLGNVTSSEDLLLQSGVFSLSTSTFAIQGNFSFEGGSFDAGTGTIKYIGQGGQSMAPVSYFNLEGVGSGPYRLTASTTVTGMLTNAPSSTVEIGDQTLTVTLLINGGTMTKTANGKIIHPAESLQWLNEQNEEIVSSSATATLFLVVQDLNRNLLGQEAETLTVLIKVAENGGSDQETVTLIETGPATGVFKSGGMLTSVSDAPVLENQKLEITSSTTALAQYTDAQDPSDVATSTIEFLYNPPPPVPAPVPAPPPAPIPPAPQPNPNPQVEMQTPNNKEEAFRSSSLIVLPEQKVFVFNNVRVPVHALVKLSDDGDLQTQYDSAVYYVDSSGRRHAFPHEKVYFTWYKDFSNILILPSEILSQLPLGANVRSKPGVKMIKFPTENKTYAVSRRGVLHWIKNESLAQALYGATWNTFIDDVSEAFYTDHVFGDDITSPEQFKPNVEQNEVAQISDDLREI